MQTDEITVQQSHEDDFQILQCLDLPSSNQTPSLCIKLNQCDALIKLAQAQQIYANKQQWKQLLDKKFQERLKSMSAIALNSIINVRFEQVQLRSMIWNTIISQLDTKYQNEYLQQQQQRQQQQQQPNQTNEKQQKQIRTNIQRMFTKLQLIQQQPSSSQLKQKLIKIIICYQQKQQLLGNIKGLQYICYGIYQASPIKQFSYLYKVFSYIMQIQNIKKIFYHGSPLYYQQLNTLCSQLKNDLPKFYLYLDKLNVDFSKIFISYYKSLLLNKINHFYVIIKIIDLILVYGICIVRMIILRIILQKWQKFMNDDPQQLMNTLGTDLVYQRLLADKDIIQINRLCQQQQNHSDQTVNLVHSGDLKCQDETQKKLQIQSIQVNVKEQEDKIKSSQEVKQLKQQQQVIKNEQKQGEEKKYIKQILHNQQNNEYLKKQQNQNQQQKLSTKKIQQTVTNKQNNKTTQLTEQKVIRKFRKLIIGI